MVYLEIISGPGTGAEVPLTEAEIVLGRSPESAVAIDDEAIAPSHAAFALGADGAYVRDLTSGHPTLVNGVPVEHAWLTPRDRVQVGPVELRVAERIASSGPAPAPAQSRGPRTPMAAAPPARRKIKSYDSGTGSAILWLLALGVLVWAGWRYRDEIRDQVSGGVERVASAKPTPTPLLEPSEPEAPLEEPPEPSPEPSAEPEPLPTRAPTKPPPPVAALPPPARKILPPPNKARTERLFFAGGGANTTFSGSHLLSNGDLLVSGGTEDLAWTGNVPRTEWQIPEGTPFIPGNGTTHGFVLHLGPDLTTIKHVYHFPKGPVADVNRIRSTEVPGNPTGAVYLSGSLALGGGYWLARLDKNIVQGQPTELVWLREIRAGGDHQTAPRWDVRNDGHVIYVSGTPYSHSWSGLGVLDGATGETGAMPDWPQEAGGPVLPLKAARENSLRSATQKDFDHRQEDENDNPGRKGRYPDDYYFQGPGLGGPGYTGYRLGQNPTQRVGQIAVDRRNNYLYFGYSTQTKLPNGLPDFEPAFVAMTDTGKLLWWARGYKEVERKGKDSEANQDGLNSPPDQYVDSVGIDYANDRLVVAARCHGNGVINFWGAGDIKRNKSKRGFQSRFTGQNGNIHIGWIGKYGLTDGKIYSATYVAELADKSSGPPAGGLISGWPDPNEGWMDVNTTRIGFMEVDHLGRPLILAIGRRPYTTRNAIIKNIPPGKGVSSWAPFARAYDPKLTDLDYSTILRGAWDKKTGTGTDDKFELTSLTPLDNGMLVTGIHRPGPSRQVTELPTVNVPAWGSAKIPPDTSAFIGLLPYGK